MIVHVYLNIVLVLTVLTNRVWCCVPEACMNWALGLLAPGVHVTL